MSALLRQMMADSPSGLWPLDELSGSIAYDRSGFARHGTYVGSPTLGAVTPVGRAVDLNGTTSQYVDLGDNAAWSSSSFTDVWAITGSNAAVTLWRNGVALLTDTTVNATPRQGDTSAPMLIGQRGLAGDQRPLDAKVAFAGYWPAVLSADRLRAHYDAGIRAGVVVG